MFIINDMIIILAICSLIAMYRKDKRDMLVILVGIYYCTLPVFKYSSNKGIDSAYFISLFLVIIIFYEIIRFKKLDINKYQIGIY